MALADLANKLKSEYAGTAYSQFGGLFVAKVAVDNGKLDDAATELKVIVDKLTTTLGEVARQRLAQVLAAQGKVDDALKLLEGDLTVLPGQPVGTQGRPAGAAGPY